MARRSPSNLLPAATLVATLACAGCGGADAKKEVETLESWRATIDLASDARVRGWVTPRYADQLRDKAREAVSQGGQLAASDKVTPAERDSLSAAGARLRAALGRLDRTGR
jgi:hypothetical protein